MSKIENINEELFRTKELINNKKYKEAVFTCDNIKKEIIKLLLNNEEEKSNNLMLKKLLEKYQSEEELLIIINNTNNILRKYDYDFQDVFDKKDAENMCLNIFKLIEFYNKIDEKK